MAFDNWKCSTKTDANGVAQPCVVTGTSTVAPAGTRCDWIMPTFCDDAVNQVALTMAITPPPGPAAPSDYTLVAGQGYYKLHTEIKTYSQAVTICASEGSIVASPIDPADYPPLKAMYMKALPFATQGFFLGLTDQVTDMAFDIAATKQPVCQVGTIEWQNVFIGIPGENCTLMAFTRNDLMQDVSCTWVIPFMCEQRLTSRYKLAPCG